MRPSTPLLAALVAVAAAAAFPITLSAGKDETEPRVASTAAAPERSTDRPRGDTDRSRGDRKLARRPAIRWRRSVAVGSPTAGRLARGVHLPNLHRSPNRAWRRWGTNRLVRLLLAIVREHRRAHPGAPPLLIGDLSRPHGGDFGRQFGYVWHASHQNGLDADIYYPRKDGGPRAPRTAADIDRRLSQDLVDRLVRAGATKVFVGPGTGLTGPPDVVQVIPQHDDHIHLRIAP
jgi:hypothetical protein